MRWLGDATGQCGDRRRRGVLAFAAPKLTCAYMIGAHSGQAVLANGKSRRPAATTGPMFVGVPYLTRRHARRPHGGAGQGSIAGVLGGKPRN